jgi:phosphodiesterase/alkaline phosphatase D-like protein
MEDIGEERYLAALQAYREALPQNRGDTGGIWRKLSWGTALDVFVLDCRSERMGDLYISTAQMDWLKQGLSASSARFKIICSSVPITDLTAIFGSVEAEDRWQGYSEQRDEILTHIETEEVEGVLWLAGDFHYGQIGRVSPEGQNGEDAWEVLCGPSGSDINLGAVFFVGGVSQYVDIVADYNWVRFTCDPMAGTIRVQHVNDVGDTLSDRVLEL